MTDATRAALAYAEAGIFPVPIPHGSKAPTLRGWQDLRLTPETVPDHFNGAPQNVGVNLSASGLADVDLDSPEAVALAPLLLPETRTFGRASKRRSHYVYMVAAPVRTERFQVTTPDGPDTLAEVRCQTRKGTPCQTVFPPSTHPSGEAVAWEGPVGRHFAEIDGDDLRRRVRCLAGVAVLVRLYPVASGGRHDAAGALASVLARSEAADYAHVPAIVAAIATRAGDDDAGDRATFAADTVAALSRGEAVTGAPRLVDLLCRSDADRAMLRKALDWLGFDGRPTASVEPTPPSPRDGTSLGVCLADVEAEAVRWAWPGWLAAGKLHVFDGDPGMGKSTILSSIAAAFTAGAPLPDGTRVPAEYRGAAVVLTAEDDPATTIRPRMEAAGADLARVSVVATVPSDDGHGRIPTFPADVPLILGHCRAVGARLLVVDPVTAYLGDVNSHRDSAVRGALAPLAAGAEEAGVAVVLVRHLNKGTGGSALYRGGGSIAFSGLARVVWIVGPDPEVPDVRALAVSKNNLAQFPEARAYELVSAGPFSVGLARWLGPRSLTADDLVRPRTDGPETPAQDDAVNFLTDTLAGGDRRAREVYAEAETIGLSERTLKRAKSRLGVEAEQRVDGDGDRAWWWTLPGGQGAKSPDVGTLARYAGDGAEGNAPHGAVRPQGAKPVAPCDDVAPCPDGGPLTPAEGLLPGQSVTTPQGPGTVTTAPSGGRVSVEVDGLPVSFPLDAVTPTEAPF